MFYSNFGLPKNRRTPWICTFLYSHVSLYTHTHTKLQIWKKKPNWMNNLRPLFLCLCVNVGYIRIVFLTHKNLRILIVYTSIWKWKSSEMKKNKQKRKKEENLVNKFIYSFGHANVRAKRYIWLSYMDQRPPHTLFTLLAVI